MSRGLGKTWPQSTAAHGPSDKYQLASGGCDEAAVTGHAPQAHHRADDVGYLSRSLTLSAANAKPMLRP